MFLPGSPSPVFDQRHRVLSQAALCVFYSSCVNVTACGLSGKFVVVEPEHIFLEFSGHWQIQIFNLVGLYQALQSIVYWGKRAPGTHRLG